MVQHVTLSNLVYRLICHVHLCAIYMLICFLLNIFFGLTRCATMLFMQPPLWERYQQHLREWELAMERSNTRLPSGCHGKAVLADKPPMHAFCLKPRGLEVPTRDQNKGHTGNCQLLDKTMHFQEIMMAFILMVTFFTL